MSNQQKKMSSKKSFQQNFEDNSDPAKGVSLCIPRVFGNINHRRIKQHMIDADLGFVERVDVIRLPNGNKRAYVHFAAGRWNMRDAEAREALTKLQNGGIIGILYDDPWFWNVSISKLARPADAPHPKNNSKRKIKLDLSGAKKTSKVRTGDDPVLARATQANELVSDEQDIANEEWTVQGAMVMARQEFLYETAEVQAPAITRQYTLVPQQLM
jgi:hypothetical protein